MTILLIIRLANQKYTNDNRKVIIKGMRRTIDIVEKQSENGNIVGVVEFNSITKREDYDDIEEQMHDLRVISNKRRKVQVFFVVQITKDVYELYKT